MNIAILNKEGVIINVVISSGSHPESHVVLNSYSTQWIGDKYSTEVEEQDRVNHHIRIEKDWRNFELERTGLLVQEPDHPYMQQLLDYRVKLREYDSKEGFPFCERPEPAVTSNGNPI